MTDLSVYIPRDRLRALAYIQSLPDRAHGAVLFADVSGFIPLTRIYAKKLGQKHGAEAILGVLNPLFETLIEPVHRYGGSVIGFAGDAITFWFDARVGQRLPLTDRIENASLRAVAAALAMQSWLVGLAEMQPTSPKLSPPARRCPAPASSVLARVRMRGLREQKSGRAPAIIKRETAHIPRLLAS